MHIALENLDASIVKKYILSVMKTNYLYSHETREILEISSRHRDVCLRKRFFFNFETTSNKERACTLKNFRITMTPLTALKY